MSTPASNLGLLASRAISRPSPTPTKQPREQTTTPHLEGQTAASHPEPPPRPAWNGAERADSGLTQSQLCGSEPGWSSPGATALRTEWLWVGADTATAQAACACLAGTPLCGVGRALGPGADMAALPWAPGGRVVLEMGVCGVGAIPRAPKPGLAVMVPAARPLPACATTRHSQPACAEAPGVWDTGAAGAGLVGDAQAPSLPAPGNGGPAPSPGQPRVPRGPLRKGFCAGVWGMANSSVPAGLHVTRSGGTGRPQSDRASSRRPPMCPRTHTGCGPDPSLAVWTLVQGRRGGPTTSSGPGWVWDRGSLPLAQAAG